MLSEDTKRRLERSTKATIKRFGLERTVKQGPSKLIGWSIAHPEVFVNCPGIVKELSENQDEAEKFVAGILGLM